MCANFVSVIDDYTADYIWDGRFYRLSNKSRDRSSEGLFEWLFCCLHGQAEEIANNCDMFLSDKPKPTEPGEYMFMLKGWRGVMIISREHMPPHLCGRGYLIGDIEAEKHCRNPKEWRQYHV